MHLQILAKSARELPRLNPERSPSRTVVDEGISRGEINRTRREWRAGEEEKRDRRDLHEPLRGRQQEASKTPHFNQGLDDFTHRHHVGATDLICGIPLV